MFSSSDVCETVETRLRNMGFDIPEEDGILDILDALAEVNFVKKSIKTIGMKYVVVVVSIGTEWDYEVHEIDEKPFKTLEKLVDDGNWNTAYKLLEDQGKKFSIHNLEEFNGCDALFEHISGTIYDDS